MANYEEMMRRQRALADFGDFVLDHEDLDEILTEGCRLIAEALGAHLAKVMQIEREADTALVRAGMGWRPGIVGHERVSLSARSSEAFAIEQSQPVISNDIANETRFEFPSFLLDHGVIALVNVPIFLPGRRPWGILQVDAREPRAFDRDDIEFLKTYSMVLGPVIDRIQTVVEREEARRNLLDREDRLHRILESALDYAIFTTDLEGHIESWSDGAQAVFGWTADEAIGQDSAMTFTLEDRENGVPQKELAQARSEGVAPNIRWHVRRDGKRVFIEGSTRPLAGDGTPRGFLKVGQDVTERKQSDQRQQILVAELQHRTRNLIAVVRSMADKTMRSTDSLQDFQHGFRDRLDALARVQGLLSRLEDHDRVAFDELIRTELTALGALDGASSRVSLSGPEGVRLRSSTVQTLAMALHELATNAAKYGALLQPDGHLDIKWQLERDGDSEKPWLHIDWRESGVTMPELSSRPKGTGQGRELIERALPYQLQAKTSYELGPDGVRCTISVPVSASTLDG